MTYPAPSPLAMAWMSGYGAKSIAKRQPDQIAY